MSFIYTFVTSLCNVAPRDFTDKETQALKNYSYSGIDKSLISNYILNPYVWNKAIEYVGPEIAPNTLTLFGFCFCIGNFLNLWYYSPNFTEPCPNWVYFTFAVGLFGRFSIHSLVYQTLDAIDGKQARRTGMSGPLGELFDHGIDAINLTFIMLLASNAINIHGGWSLYIMFVTSTANFYFCSWEYYHTRTLYLPYFSGPVEGILAVVLVHIISGIWSPLFWENKFYSIPLNQYMIAFGAIVALLSALTSYVPKDNPNRCINVVSAKRYRGESVLFPFLGLIPLVTFYGCIYYPLSISKVLLDSYMVWVCVACGCLFALHVSKVILAHLTLSSFPFINWEFVVIWGMVSAGCWYINSLKGNEPLWLEIIDMMMDFGEGMNAISFISGWAIFGAAVLSLYLLLSFGIASIRGICRKLKIFCFSIKKVITVVEVEDKEAEEEYIKGDLLKKEE